MGARGNSGVILSQILRGIARGLEGYESAGALQLANALQSGVDAAYRAVMKPVEGTILTVVKEVAKGALNAVREGEENIATVLTAAYNAGNITLAKTPEMLPVLKQAGVVDAGGYGLLVIISGWILALEGKEVPQGEVVSTAPQPVLDTGITLIDNLDFPYCTEFLVKGEQLNTDTIRAGLEDKGDCLLVVGMDDIVKIHIHSKNPGEILAYAIGFGSLHSIQISNMLSQNEAIAHERRNAAEASGTQASALTPALPAHKQYGFVAVTMGEGIAEVFRSLGVDEIVSGGQTMNPSTKDIADAVRLVDAKQVFILPNNSNIVLAAGQVSEIIEGQSVHVVPTKSAPQGISALLAFNPDKETSENLESMTAAIADVQSGEVTFAVRDSHFDGVDIHEGDIIGLTEGKIVAACPTPLAAARAVLTNMNWQEHDVVTVFYGEETPLEQAKELEDWMAAENPEVEVDVHAGLQPLYYYILSVE
jgi:DAK2 domain fusion protein YloV